METRYRHKLSNKHMNEGTEAKRRDGVLDRDERQAVGSGQVARIRIEAKRNHGAIGLLVSMRFALAKKAWITAFKARAKKGDSQWIERARDRQRRYRQADAVRREEVS